MTNTAETILTTDESLGLGLIKVSGDDTLTFLQGQLSNDIHELNSGTEKQWHYSGYCNQKGRLIALCQIWRDGEDVFLLMSKDLVQNSVERLRKYVMRSKVVIEVLESVACRGILSTEAMQNTDAHLMEKLNVSANAVVSNSEQAVLKINTRYLLINITGGVENIYSKKIAKRSSWLAAQIENGLPNVSLDSSEMFIPQMLNLDLLGGINFKKGCYTGQEIVARMHYLGKLKQRMFVCDLTEGDAANLKPGDNIYSDVDLSKSIGTVVSSALNSNKLLAILRLTELDNTHYADNNTQIKVAAKQPYDIPLAADK